MRTMKAGTKWKLAQHLEYKWWQRYLRNKNEEEYIQWKTAYWLRLLERIVPWKQIPENQHILDAGCGPAGVFMALQGNEVDAIDPLLDRYTGLKHFKPDRFGWVRFTNMPLELLDAKDTYDMIFCLNAINHVNDISMCYQKLANALKPGGYLIISTDAHRYHFLEKIFRLIPGDMLHPVQMTIDGYLSLLHKNSLAVTENVLYERGNIFHYYITVAQKK